MLGLIERRTVMHGFKIGMIGAAALVAAVLATGSASANSIPTTGSQIGLGTCVASPCTSTFPAGEPFFIRHGFISDGTPGDVSVLLNPGTRFVLTVDGEQAASTVDLDRTAEPPSKLNLSNFRFGLTGVHTFVGCWYVEGTLLYCGTRTVTFTA
jgi:hypothetical protein